MLFDGGGGAKLPRRYAGAQRIDHVLNAQGSVRGTLKICDSPRIWLQPLETLAGYRIDDCAMAVLQVVSSKHLEASG